MFSREDSYSIKLRRTPQPQDPSGREALFLGYPGSLHGELLPFQSFCSPSQVSALNLLIPGKQPTGPVCRDRAVEGAVLLSSGQKLRKSKATLVQSDPEPRNGAQLPQAHSCVLAGWNRFQQTPRLSWHFFDSFLTQVPCPLCTELDLPILYGDPARCSMRRRVGLGVEQPRTGVQGRES